MKLGITSQGVTGPLVKVDSAGLQQVRAWGFNCIGTGVMLDEPLPADEVRRIRGLLDDHGIEVGQAWVPGSFISADDRAAQSLPRMRTSLDALGKLGIRAAVCSDGSLSPVGGFRPHPRNRDDAAFDVAVARCREVMKAAEDAGVYLCVECHTVNVLYSPERMLQFIEAVGSPNIGLNIDIVNWLSFENVYRTAELTDRTFDLLGERIFTGHIKDAVVEDKLIIHMSETWLGNGIVDSAAYFKRFVQLEPWKATIIEHIPQEHIPEARAFCERLARENGFTWDGLD